MTKLYPCQHSIHIVMATVSHMQSFMARGLTKVLLANGMVDIQSLPEGKQTPYKVELLNPIANNSVQCIIMTLANTNECIIIPYRW